MCEVYEDTRSGDDIANNNIRKITPLTTIIEDGEWEGGREEG